MTTRHIAMHYIRHNIAYDVALRRLKLIGFMEADARSFLNALDGCDE